MPHSADQDDRKNGATDFPDSSVLSRLRRNLVRWYGKYARDLPWRRSRDPYQIWVSEIMLQQTTVAAVAPFFERFLKRFPTLHDLAAAGENDVLRLWEGLGYYSRARNLRVAACQIIEEHGGRIPSDVSELVRLHGVGRYTAGAIASFAYDEPAPIVEANTLRVYARLLAFRGDPHSTAGKNVIWSFAEQVVPNRSAGIFNSALMDLGALVCTPADPNCAACPVRSCCRAFREGTQREIPRPKPRPATTFVTDAMVAIRKEGRFLLRKSPAAERWAGLWEFLRIRLEKASSDQYTGSWNGRKKGGSSRQRPASNRVLSTQTRQCIEQAVAELCGLNVNTDRDAFEFHHTVTRFRILLVCATAECVGGALNSDAEFRWTAPRQFGRHALSAPARKFADRIVSRKSQSAHK